jgi:unsaturated rhamnogalacturonyl hydrolase
LASALLVLGASGVWAKPMVALDEYHSNYTAPHYTYAWWDKTLGGYSKFAGIVTSLGADTTSLHAPIDSAVLSKVQVLIIVDPDTLPSKFIQASEITAVDSWVQRGGTLMLFANNAGTCEFTHLNQLATKFGTQFNGDTYGGSFNLTPLPTHAFFTGCKTIHIKNMSTQTVSPPAQAVLTLSGKVLMATSTKGLGKIFALGDPWLYNEYIDSADNVKAGTNVMRWILTPNPTSLQAARTKSILSRGGVAYSILGRRRDGAPSWAQSVGIGVYHAPSVP